MQFIEYVVQIKVIIFTIEIIVYVFIYFFFLLFLLLFGNFCESSGNFLSCQSITLNFYLKSKSKKKATEKPEERQQPWHGKQHQMPEITIPLVSLSLVQIENIATLLALQLCGCEYLFSPELPYTSASDFFFTRFLLSLL